MVIVGSGSLSVRNDPLPDRAGAGHDLPALGLLLASSRSPSATYLEYLIAGAWRCPKAPDKSLEIGGADVVTYGEMMTDLRARFAGFGAGWCRCRCSRRTLSSYWVSLRDAHSRRRLPRPLIAGAAQREHRARRSRRRCRFSRDSAGSTTGTAVEAGAGRSSVPSDVETAWSDALMHQPMGTLQAGHPRPPMKG